MTRTFASGALAYTELDVALCEPALRWHGSFSVDPEGAEVAERWHHKFSWSRARTISSGASEIIRGLIARQLMRLSRA